MELPGLDLSAATALLSWPLIVCLLVSSAAAFLPCSAAKYHAYRARKLQPRGCRRLGGGGGPSTLSDQFEDRPGVSETSRPVREPSAAPWIVKGLWIYPVKSCRGVELRRASVAPTGLQYDRQFSFAQLLEATANGAASKSEGAPRWRFLTQRQCSSLALVQTELWVPATDSPTYSADGKDVRNGGAIIITFPNPEATGRSILHRMGRSLGFVPGEISFCVPLDPSDGSIQEDGYVTEQMAIWKDAPPALNMSKHMPEELQRFLGLKNRVGLFRVSHGHERRVFRCAPKKEQLGWQPVTGFADAVCRNHALHCSGAVRSDGRTNTVSDTPAESRDRARSQQETRKGHSQAGHSAFPAQPHRYVVPTSCSTRVSLRAGRRSMYAVFTCSNARTSKRGRMHLRPRSRD